MLSDHKIQISTLMSLFVLIRRMLHALIPNRCKCLLAVCSLSAAASAQIGESDTIFNLNEVVVTATRTPKQLMDVPIQTRVITAQDIEKTDATDVEDLLQQEMPGVEFSYAMNLMKHLNFSGFGGQGVLILVDGERQAGETMDDVDFARLNMANVQHLEIVRGAASALYGSNAGGGVINIITKDGTNLWKERPWALNVNARIARHNEQRYAGTFNLNGKKVNNMLNFTYHGTDNFNVENEENPKTSVFTTVYGDKTYHLKDKITYHPMEGLTITGHAGYFFRTISRTADTPERYRDFNGGLRGQWNITKDDDLEVIYNFDQYDKSDYQKLARLDIRDYSNVQNTLRAIYNHHFGNDAILTFGADYMHDYLYNIKLTDKSREQDSFDAFVQADWTVSPKWEVVGALRYDYFSDGKNSQLTPKVSARYKALSNLSLRFGYGMGFRAPTLKEKYYDFDVVGIWILQGNEKLKSEVSHNFNASIEWMKKNWCVTASAYYNKVNDKLSTGIPFYKPGDDKQLYLSYLNLESYSVSGAELTVQTRWSNGISGKVSYAYTKENLPKDKDGKTINNQYIPARPHALNLRVDWTHQWNRHYNLNIAISGRVHSGVDNVEFIDYYDIAKGTQEISYPAYTIWKLSTIHRIGKALKLTLALDNLFNYRPKYYYYNAPITDGINFMAGVSIDIDRLF